MKILLPILILFAAVIIFGIQQAFKREPSVVAPERPITSVEIITVQPQTIQLSVRSQGTLLPTIETDLTTEVSGRVIDVATNFRAGNTFRKGDILLTIDSADYKAASAARLADLASAELGLAREQALADQAASDWQSLGEGEASALTLRKPQLKQAMALVASAQAAVAKAERDLDRTEIKAPYTGIVLTKNVALGQFVVANPANPIARIYATESAEIRLPITQREATFLDQQTKRQRFVTLSPTDDSIQTTWQARLSRIEDNISPTSRLLFVVAELIEPFTTNNTSNIPLRRGTFLKAEIEGRSVENTYILPRLGLRGSNTVYVLTDGNILTTRTVNIIKSTTEHVFIESGLAPGERIAISPIAYYIEGMTVEVIETETETEEAIQTATPLSRNRTADPLPSQIFLRERCVRSRVTDEDVARARSLGAHRHAV